MKRTLEAVPAAVGDCLDARATATGRYLVRIAGPADAEAIREFVFGLSVQSQYLRFFTAVAPPSRGLLRALTDSGPHADILIATDEIGLVIGHGMAVDGRQDRPALTGTVLTGTVLAGTVLAGTVLADTVLADTGLVVADQWQGQGVGTAMLRLLIERAVSRGVRALLFEVLPDNARMLGIIDRHWPDAARKRIPDAISITARIGPPADVLSTGAHPVANGRSGHEPRQSAA